MALLPGGGYAQYAKVLRSHTIPMWDGMSWDTAAAIPEVYCAAYMLLHREAQIRPGETCLLHAAASGVGTAMI